MTDKRIILFKNETKTQGKVLFVPETLDQLLRKASQKFKSEATGFYTPEGGEIDDINLIRDNDVLYVCFGEEFIHPGTKKVEVEDKPKKSDWVTLNVGGKLFTTSKSTLTKKEPMSMLARMFAEEQGDYLFTPSNIDDNGAYLVDRSPTYFEPILNYLRNGQLIYDANVNPEGILEEAKFFGIESIIPALENIIKGSQTSRDNMPLTRRDIVDALIKSPYTYELRFQGVNLSGADLSKLDLRWCCLERADLSHAILDGAQLLGVKSLCANMEGAQLRNCNFEDPAGSRANMEGVNLKGANLEGSDMGGVNLRVATLKNANLQNCDLRAAVLAGADLENCDLSGSDLHEANLRGANLKDAAFELMLTPLHMSQTIR
ncbi:hypothetical protein Trydic_g6748 [Trypoxylus dichotomus]